MKAISIIFITVFIYSCNQKPNNLPIIGFQEKQEDGSINYHKIPPFSFSNQNGEIIDNESFKDKIYIADFFFTSCPSICPKVMKQMMRIADAQKDNDNFMLISHTIDPKRDNIDVLKKYANNLGVDQKKWHFLTGDKDNLLDMADEYYV
ncbi:MAG: SCO family protein, partial [Saprospiraceae bacterium]